MNVWKSLGYNSIIYYASVMGIDQTYQELEANNQTPFTSEYQQDERITIPVAHGEGNYYCDKWESHSA